MSLLDRFKRKPKKEAGAHAAFARRSDEKTRSKTATKIADDRPVTEADQSVAARAGDVAPTKQTAAPATSGKALTQSNAARRAHRVLLRPVVSEKSAHVHTMNQYIFHVAPDATKSAVKQAIFELYQAKAIGVQIVVIGGKRVTRGKISGMRRDYKKAIVRMPKGVTLPVYEGV